MAKLEIKDLERLRKKGMLRMSAKDQSIPGIYERHMTDILNYLQAKFPQLGKDEVAEAVGCISNRTMVMVQDILIERDREWKKIFNKTIEQHDRNFKRAMKIITKESEDSDEES